MKTLMLLRIIWGWRLLKLLSRIWRRLNRTNSKKLKLVLIRWLQVYNQTRKLDNRKCLVWLMIFILSGKNARKPLIKKKAENGWSMLKTHIQIKLIINTLIMFKPKWYIKDKCTRRNDQYQFISLS